MRAAVLTLFFLSGACGLVYEVVWSRMLSQIFGSTVLAVATVLAAFMAGLALGSYWLGRVADRRRNPLRLYALYEIGIGVAALVSTLAIDRTGSLYAWLYGVVGEAAPLLAVLRFVVAFTLVLVPTVLMGATLPILARFVITRLDRAGGGLSTLYAVNTAGAVAGSLAAGFLLIGTLGIHRSIYLAVGCNLAIGLAAWFASAAAGGSAVGQTAPSRTAVPATIGVRPPAAESGRRWLLWAVGLSGFTSFAYEVYWTRSLVHLVGNSTYAFTMMLVAFLSGLAAGGYLIRFAVDRPIGHMRWFAWLQILIGASSAVALPVLFSVVESDVLRGLLGRTAGELPLLVLSRFLVALMVMLVPATLIGATFPLAGRIYLRDLRRTGSDVGTVYAANTVGNVLGALAPGALLLPRYGIQRGIVLMAALNLALGGFILLARSRRLAPLRFALPAAFVGAAVLLAGVSFGFQFPSQGQTAADRVLYYREGLSGTTKVFQDPGSGEKRMSIDGIVIGGSGATDYKQQVLAHLTKLLLDSYESELTVGLGSGILAGESARHPAVRRLVGIEIEPSVVEGAAYFAAESHDVLHDPRTEVVIDDVTSFLRTGSERFDIVSADEKTADNYASNGFSYSTEYYRLLRSRLSARGMVIQWIPNDLPPGQYRMILATFVRAFPHVTAWYFPPAGKVALTSTFVTGSLAALEIDPRRMSETLEAEGSAFDGWRKYGLTTAESVLAHYVADQSALLAATDGELQNSLEHPYYEFYSPADYAEPVNDRVLRNHAFLVGLRRTGGLSGLMERLPGGVTARLAAVWQAEDAYLDGFAGQLEGRPHHQIARRYDAALRTAPWNDNLRRQVQSYYWNLAGVHYLRGEFSDALALIGTAARIYPADGEVRYYHGLTLARTGAAQAALAEMEAAVALAPRLLAPRRALTELREQLLGPASPRLADGLAELGTLLLAVGELGEARSALERALRIRSRALGEAHRSVAASYRDLARLELAEGDRGAALAALQRAIERGLPAADLAADPDLEALSEEPRFEQPAASSARGRPR